MSDRAVFRSSLVRSSGGHRGDFYIKLCSWASGELALDPWEPVCLLLTDSGGLHEGGGGPGCRGNVRDVLRPVSGLWLAEWPLAVVGAVDAWKEGRAEAKAGSAATPPSRF